MNWVTKSLAMLAAVVFTTTQELGAQQVRGILGAGVSFPVGDFAQVADDGGGNALAGIEWFPTNRNLGIRVDGTYQRFCTNACTGAEDLDIRRQILNGNVSGFWAVPTGDGAPVRPYVLAGAGVYNHKLQGDDVPAGSDESQTDFGVSGGLGLTMNIRSLAVFAEGRYHNIFTDGNDFQYIPITVGIRIGSQHLP